MWAITPAIAIQKFCKAAPSSNSSTTAESCIGFRTYAYRPVVTSRRGGSNGTGVPAPRVANSWTADNPASAGIARICTIRLSCQFGRANGLIQVLPEPSMMLAGRRNNMSPQKAITCSVTRPGEVLVADGPPREQLTGNANAMNNPIALAGQPCRSESQHW